MDIYREKLLDHYNNPRNFGNLKPEKYTIELENASCGDVIKMQIDMNSNSTIKSVHYEGEGCAVAIASASILSEYAVGKTSEYLLNLSLDDFLQIIGIELTLSRIKCANLSLEALKNGLKQLTGS